MRPVDEETFKVVVKVNVSNQFFGWLCGIGKGVKIIEPTDVASDYKNNLSELMKEY